MLFCHIKTCQNVKNMKWELNKLWRFMAILSSNNSEQWNLITSAKSHCHASHPLVWPGTLHLCECLSTMLKRSIYNLHNIRFVITRTENALKYIWDMSADSDCAFASRCVGLDLHQGWHKLLSHKSQVKWVHHNDSELWHMNINSFSSYHHLFFECPACTR